MIDPIALQIGPVAIHWYGISYGVGLGVGIWILWLLNKKAKVFKDLNQIFDFAFWFFLAGVILGGRLGYVLFYNLSYFIENPSQIPAVWSGGMSFHGGLIAAIIVGYIFCKKNKIDFMKLGDMAVIPGALALTFTRLANFVNQELVGRIIENPKWMWLGMDFGDGLLRYPSQLFQSASSLLLFIVLLVIYSFKPTKGVLIFSYLMFYGLFRFFTEMLRAPDVQIGYIFNYLTMGQILCLFMVAAGSGGLMYLRR